MRSPLRQSRGRRPAKTPDREGVVAVLPDQQALDRVLGIFHDLQIGDELHLEATFDAALRRMREGTVPRVLLLDLSDSPSPIAVLSNARKIGGGELKIVALGTVNDVGLYRDLIVAGASDYLVKPVSREALAPSLERNGADRSGGRLARTGCRLYRQSRRGRDDDRGDRLRLAPRRAA